MTPNQQIVRHPDKFFIGGKWTQPSSDARITVTNSATEELFLSVAEAKAADVDRAVAAAREAFDKGPWSRLSHDQRATCMRAMAAELDKLADPHARIWTTEAGALHTFTKARCAGISNDYLAYAAMAESFPFQERHKPRSGR
jgi:acyl-CoA reductase-like NAD-dependent aldehyde dehydrogenase